MYVRKIEKKQGDCKTHKLILSIILFENYSQLHYSNLFKFFKLLTFKLQNIFNYYLLLVVNEYVHTHTQTILYYYKARWQMKRQKTKKAFLDQPNNGDYGE